MKWTLKPIIFTKSETEESTYFFDVKIHDMLHTRIIIKPYEWNVHPTTFYWQVTFKPLNNYEGFNVCEETGRVEYTRYGFKTFKDAKDYANIEYQFVMNKIVKNIIKDLNNYVEVDYNETV
jgi:hypothetical protein